MSYLKALQILFARLKALEYHDPEAKALRIVITRSTGQKNWQDALAHLQSLCGE